MAGGICRRWLCGAGDPGVAFSGADEGVGPVDAVTGGCGEVGMDGAEGLRSMHGAHAAGDLDAELAHLDDPFSLAVIEREPAGHGQTAGNRPRDCACGWPG